MKITYKGDYALKALFYLSLSHYERGNGVVSIAELARAGDMPVKFLEQILLALRKGGFVKSKRGLKGGFILARHPRDITVGEVIRFIEGPTGPIGCVEEGYKGCRDVARCIFRTVWKEVDRAISLVVDTLTFEELVVRHKERSLALEKDLSYAI